MPLALASPRLPAGRKTQRSLERVGLARFLWALVPIAGVAVGRITVARPGWLALALVVGLTALQTVGSHQAPHRVLVEGPRRLRGIRLESPDIRAGMALVVAGLCAERTTIIEHAEIIMRGYENVAERLTAIGAAISQQ